MKYIKKITIHFHKTNQLHLDLDQKTTYPVS